jgi:hypothetical protein
MELVDSEVQQSVAEKAKPAEDLAARVLVVEVADVREGVLVETRRREAVLQGAR